MEFEAIIPPTMPQSVYHYLTGQSYLDWETFEIQELYRIGWGKYMGFGDWKFKSNVLNDQTEEELFELNWYMYNVLKRG